MLVIPDPLPRGVYCSGFYFPGRRVSVAAVSATHMCLTRLVVGTRAELEAAVTTLTLLLDAEDPPRGSRPTPPTPPWTPPPATLSLVR